MSGPSERAALARVPDHPRWVDTRGMLLTGRAVVSFHQPAHLDTDGFVVELASRALLSAFDNPPASLIAQRARALAGDVNVLVAPESSAPVAAALPARGENDAPPRARVSADPAKAKAQEAERQRLVAKLRAEAPKVDNLPPPSHACSPTWSRSSMAGSPTSSRAADSILRGSDRLNSRR